MSTHLNPDRARPLAEVHARAQRDEAVRLAQRANEHLRWLVGSMRTEGLRARLEKARTALDEALAVLPQ